MPLTYTTDDHECEFTIEYDRHDGDRFTYKWCIAEQRVDSLRDESGNEVRSVIWYETIATGTDLRGPVMDSFGTPPSLAEMMASFASFLGAWAESPKSLSELFPESVRPHAGYADELYMEFGDLEINRRID